MEAGDVSVVLSDLMALLNYLKVTDSELRESILADARFARSRQSSWWNAPALTEYLSAAELSVAQYELDANSIRSFVTMAIPPRMRSPEYAAAASQMTKRIAQGRSSMEELLQEEAARRRRFAARLSHIAVNLLLDESVLYRAVGGQLVLQDQLEELLGFTEFPTVELRVLPFAESAKIGQSAEFEILELGPNEFATYLRADPAGEILEQYDSAAYRQIFERLWSAAHSPIESVRSLRRRLDELSRFGPA